MWKVYTVRCKRKDSIGWEWFLLTAMKSVTSNHLLLAINAYFKHLYPNTHQCEWTLSHTGSCFHSFSHIREDAKKAKEGKVTFGGRRVTIEYADIKKKKKPQKGRKNVSKSEHQPNHEESGDEDREQKEQSKLVTGHTQGGKFYPRLPRESQLGTNIFKVFVCSFHNYCSYKRV